MPKTKYTFLFNSFWVHFVKKKRFRVFWNLQYHGLFQEEENNKNGDFLIIRNLIREKWLKIHQRSKKLFIEFSTAPTCRFLICANFIQIDCLYYLASEVAPSSNKFGSGYYWWCFKNNKNGVFPVHIKLNNVMLSEILIYIFTVKG